jgi:DNA-binding MarR family transcriptional regulator
MITMTTDLNAGRLSVSALHLLHRAGQQAEDLFMRESSNSVLTPRQYAVLLAVSKNEDISQTGLVAATGIDRSTLADVARRLVDKGFLQRKRTKSDARMYAVRMTTKGRDALARTEPSAQRADDKILATLSVKQRADFFNILGAIVTGLDELAAAA